MPTEKKPIKYPYPIKAVYDNGGDSIDRYSVYFSKKWSNADPYHSDVLDCLALNGCPFHPQFGFCQHTTGRLGKHNGERIAIESLPVDTINAILHDFDPDYSRNSKGDYTFTSFHKSAKRLVEYLQSKGVINFVGKFHKNWRY